MLLTSQENCTTPNLSIMQGKVVEGLGLGKGGNIEDCTGSAQYLYKVYAVMENLENHGI